MVQRCGHTYRTIREVDGLSRSTLFFGRKSTPSAVRRPRAGLARRVPVRPAARRAPSARGGHVRARSVQKKVQKVAPTPFKGCSFWGKGSENHTFWPLFTPKTQLLLGSSSPNYTVQFILSRPSFMLNGIYLAPREHTTALTLGTSQLTLVDALTRKPLGQSSSNSLCNRVV